VRNGPEALALVEKIAGLFPNDHAFVNIAAAALAENGRFVEAVATAERALALARAAGNQNVETLVAQRIEAYRAGRPWRQ
jgi:Flp pilus assembly protein TadD